MSRHRFKHDDSHFNKLLNSNSEATRGTGVKNVTVNTRGCGFDSHSRKCNNI